MKQDFRRATHSLALLTRGIGVAGLSGYADVPYIAGATQAFIEKADLQTGSNLKSRDKGSSRARRISLDAMESRMRGINANRDNGN